MINVSFHLQDMISINDVAQIALAKLRIIVGKTSLWGMKNSHIYFVLSAILRNFAPIKPDERYINGQNRFRDIIQGVFYQGILSCFAHLA